MEHLSLRHLRVVDVAGRLVGMISDRDVRGPRSRAGRPRAIMPPPATSVRDVMTIDVFTAVPDAELAAVSSTSRTRAGGRSS